MNINNYKHYRKAVSPVIAVVLLIALTVASGAVIWAITNGLLGSSNSTRLVVDEYGVADTNSNDIGDLIQLRMRNIGSETATVNNVVVKRDGAVMSSWVLLSNAYTIKPGEVGIIEMQTLVSSEEISSIHDVTIEVGNSAGTITSYDLKVPSSLSSLPVLYDASTGFSGINIAAQGWTTYTYNTHGGGGAGVYESNGDILFDTNNDVLFYLVNDTQKMKNGVITADFLYGDNDGIGIAFRITNQLNYYWVGFTDDHNGPQNTQNENNNNFDGPIFTYDRRLEIHKIVNGIDTLLDNKVPSTFTIISGSANNLRGPYSLRISVSGTTLAFEARQGTTGNYEEIFSLTDNTFTNAGYFGVFSLAAQNSRLDNFSVTA